MLASNSLFQSVMNNSNISIALIGALLSLIIGSYSDDWNIQCPSRTETLEECFANSPFSALILINEVKQILPVTYNVSATVQCVLKGGYVDQNIEISDIKRIVDDNESPCHTLKPNQQYIVFMKLGQYGNYILLDYSEVSYDPDDTKLLAQLLKIGGLEPLEIGTGKCPQYIMNAPNENKDEEIDDQMSINEKESIANDIYINDGVNNYIETQAGIDFEMDVDSQRTSPRRKYQKDGISAMFKSLSVTSIVSIFIGLIIFTI
ncbi:hypothetical protein GJ496_009044 [Pomphorhynchus laevis]|nr:hypothetical protein GJ496_009044 [Pomphorhynchus laevis]